MVLQMFLTEFIKRERLPELVDTVLGEKRVKTE